MIKQKSLIKIIAFFSCLIFLICAFSIMSSASNKTELPFPAVSGASNIFLYNYESDTVILNRSSNAKIAPASTVKIMVGLLAIEHLGDKLDQSVTINSEMLNGVQGYTVGLEEGTTLKIRDLLYGLLCGGGNDAATAIAVLCSDSVDAFVKEMNEKSAALGCTDTHYTNPTGIDDSAMTTSLTDTVTISKLAINNDIFMEMCSVASYTFIQSNGTEKTFRNRNALISNHSAIGYQNKNVKGLNAGMTDQGGYCVSAYATDGKSSYLCVVMGGTVSASGKITSYSITNTLLTYAFDNYKYTLIGKKGDVIENIAVNFALPTNGSEAVTVQCVLKDDIYAYAPYNNDYKNELTYKSYFFEETLKAPVKENTPVGGVDIYYNGSYIASGQLVAQNDVKESSLLLTINRMKSFMLSRSFIFFILIFAMLLCIYFYITVWRKKKR